MYASPIQAMCRNCGGEFALYEIVERHDARCPWCLQSLSPDWESVLFEQAEIADRTQQTFVKSLQRLAGLPGNLVILPYSVLRNLFEEIGWEITISKDPDVMREELRLLHEEIRHWDQLNPDRAGLPKRLRHVASRLRYLGGVADALGTDSANEQAASHRAREAANGLESVADEIAEDSSKDSKVDENLASARRAVEELNFRLRSNRAS